MIKQLVLLSALFALTSQAQTITVHEIRDYPDIKFARYFSINDRFLISQNKILLTNQLNITLAETNRSTHVDLVPLIPKQLRKKISSDYGFRYSYSNHQLVVTNRNNVFVFDEHKNKFRFNNHFKLKNRFPSKDLYHHKDKIHIYGVYNENPASEEIPSGILTLNTKDSSEKIQTIPFDYLPITHFGPNNFIDFDSNGYLVCDPLLYKIRFYDLNHQLRDSICGSHNNFTPSDTAVFKKQFNVLNVSQNPGRFIPEMGEYLSKIDRIWAVNYVNPNTIFIRLTRNSLKKQADDPQQLYDHVWKKINNIWKLIIVKEIRHTEFNSNLISKNDLWPYFIPGSKLLFSDGFLYYCFWSSADNTFPQPAKSFYGAWVKNNGDLFLKVVKFSFEQ